VLNDVPWTYTTLLGHAEMVKDWWIASLRAMISVDCVLQEVVGTDLTTAASPGAVAIDSLPSAGGDTNRSAPNNVALCVSFHTLLRGRSYRGRNYVCGISTIVITGSTVSEAWRGAVVDAYTQLFAAVNGGGFNLCVVSRRSLGALRSPAIATGVIAFSADATVDSQRRRLPGRGA